MIRVPLFVDEFAVVYFEEIRLVLLRETALLRVATPAMSHTLIALIVASNAIVAVHAHIAVWTHAPAPSAPCRATRAAEVRIVCFFDVDRLAIFICLTLELFLQSLVEKFPKG
jgi:hypothetical protein